MNISIYYIVLNSKLLANFKTSHCLSYTKHYMSKYNRNLFSTEINIISLPGTRYFETFLCILQKQVSEIFSYYFLCMHNLACSFKDKDYRFNFKLYKAYKMIFTRRPISS